MSTENVVCRVDRGLHEWMRLANGSILVTTYHADRVVVAGWDGERVSLLLRRFDRPMGLALEGTRLALALRHEVVFLSNAPVLAPHFPEAPGRYDALFLPRVTFHTGDLNVHDIALAGGCLWLVNTRCSCLVTLSGDHSFEPAWKPPFISALVPEDRCHLNGLAVADGRPRFVTALGESDTAGGWRPNRRQGGIVVDVESGETILRDLAIPHSPRWHRNHLWLLESGAGKLLRLDPATGRCDVVCQLPGYLRGLFLLDNVALVGLGRIRPRHADADLPVQRAFDQLLCGVAVVDLASGRQLGFLEFTGCDELYDVAFVPGLRRPMLLERDHPVARRAFTAPDFAYYTRPDQPLADTPRAAGVLT